MKKISIALSVAMLSGIIFFMHSCKKNDEKNSAENIDRQANEKELIKARIGKDGITVVMPVNQKLEAYYVDKAGNRVPEEILMRHNHSKSIISDAITSACDFSNTPSATMVSYTLTSLCTSGYSISWNYTVSTNNNIVATNGATTSKGFLKIYNSSNVLQYSLNVTPATIVDNGADPSNPGFELFSVSFTSGYVSPTSYFTSTNIIKLGATS